MGSQNFAMPHAGNIVQKTFANGLTVLVYENFNASSVVVNGSLHAGSVYEPLELVGLASMTANGLTRGTTTRDFDAFHSTLEDIGADLSFGASKFRVTFDGRALAEDLPVLLDVLADALHNPTFPAAEVDEERTMRLTELNYAQQNTRFMASRIFREALYPVQHPYHHFTYGALETLPKITPEAMRRFHAQHYGPRGMLLVIVGAVKAEDALNIAAQKFADWDNPQQGAIPQLPPITAPDDIKQVTRLIPGKTQTDIVLGTLGPARKSQDYLAASLANSILGEFGMMGRIGDVIRERLGLAYYAYSRLEAGHGPGTWQVVIGVAPEDIATALDNAREQIRRFVDEGISADELADNQSYFTGRLPLQLENNGGLAAIIHDLKRYDYGLDYLLHYRDAVYNITRADVQEAAQRYLNPDKIIIALAGSV